MVDRGLRVLCFVDFHLFDHRTALRVGFRQFLQMAVEMRLDLAFGFGVHYCLGAMLARRGLSGSESWMRADTHDGPELKLHPEA